MVAFAPTRTDTLASRRDAARRWSGLAAQTPVDGDVLDAAWARIAGVAREIGGTTLDGPQRAVVYFSIYEDSLGNFMFPMTAAHGSLWGVSHTRRIDRLLRAVRPLSRRGRIDRWLGAIDDVRDVNRRVFREVYTTFYFTRYYGRHPEATRFVRPEVLALYNRVHAAVAEGVTLPYAERRAIYYDVFVHEQLDIVNPGLQAAALASGTPMLLRVLKHVRPRFAYFPPGKRLFFDDFTSIDQRNREGLRACDFAEEVGSARVLEAMAEY